MQETIDIGAVPLHETTLSISDPDFSPQRLLKQAVAYCSQITRHYGAPPCGAGIYISVRSRKMGRVTSVTVNFDADDGEASSYIMAILLDTRNALKRWDAVAKHSLGDNITDVYESFSVWQALAA